MHIIVLFCIDAFFCLLNLFKQSTTHVQVLRYEMAPFPCMHDL